MFGMPFKERKNTSLNNNKGLAKPGPQIQEVIKGLSELLQKNPLQITLIKPPAAPESITPEEN